MADVSRANSKLPKKEKPKQKEDEHPSGKKPANGQHAEKKSGTAPVDDPPEVEVEFYAEYDPDYLGRPAPSLCPNLAVHLLGGRVSYSCGIAKQAPPVFSWNFFGLLFT
ncbi:unnamed protein product [Cyprideis torosa]|uniref:Uncharacterized protein n=1 Tax=Cyprideis torosa TaxID=163714 RepID=A0A7R8WBP8_9CRUS|nr:unnamed protein product [Cyprideis torosa]CAG0892525.1 unnamed protein product [Cyprideis torosa]